MEKIKKILLQYHVYERENMILSILGNYLTNNDFNVRISSMYDFKTCFEFMPDVIITHTIRDYDFTAAISIMKLVTGCILIPMTVEGFYDINNKEIVKASVGINVVPRNLIDHYIMWGPLNKKVESSFLLKTNKIKSLEQISVCGYIPYDKNKMIDYFTSLFEYKEFIQWIDKYDSCITCLTGFINAETSIEETIEMSTYVNKKGTDEYFKEIENFKRKINSSIVFREKYINVIIKLANSYPNIGFVVKLHPVEMSYYKNGKCRYYKRLLNYNNIFLVTNSAPVAMYLSKSRLMIHYGSTVSMESYIWKVPSIMLYDQELLSYQYGTRIIDVDNYVSIQEAIENIVFINNEYAETVLHDYFNYDSCCEYSPVESITKLLTTKCKKSYITLNEINKTIPNKVMSRYRFKVFRLLLNEITNFNFNNAKKILIILKYKLKVTIPVILKDFINVLILNVKKERS